MLWRILDVSERTNWSERTSFIYSVRLSYSSMWCNVFRLSYRLTSKTRDYAISFSLCSKLRRELTVVPSGIAMFEVQSFGEESFIVPEDGFVDLWFKFSMVDFALLYREILALLDLWFIEFEEVLVPVITLLDVFDSTDARYSEVICL